MSPPPPCTLASLTLHGHIYTKLQDFTKIPKLQPAMKLGQGYVFTCVCDSVHWGGGVSQHALQVVSQHSLQQVSREGGLYPSMPCRFPGPHPGGKLRGLVRARSPGPHPRGKLRGLAWGGLQAHTGGSPGPRLVGLQAHTQGGCIPACNEADPNLRRLLLSAVGILLEYILVSHKYAYIR